MHAGSVTARLETLRAEGAEAFDAPALRFIEQLLAKAEHIGGGAGDRLRARAEARLDALQADLDAARQKASEAIEALAEIQDPEGAAAVAEVQRLVEAGDHRGATRAAARLQRGLVDRRQPKARARVERQIQRAEAAGVSLPSKLKHQITEALEDPQGSPEILDALADEAGRALYRAAADDTHATVVVARAGDAVPDEAGPYNPQAVSAKALAALEALSPAHLRHWVRHLEGFDALARLPAPPAPKARKTTRRSR